MSYLKKIYGAHAAVSRPFFLNCRRELKTQTEQDVASFCEAFNDFGKVIIGGPFDYCLDTDVVNSFGCWVHSSDEATILSFSETEAFQDVLKKMPEDIVVAFQSFLGIVKEKHIGLSDKYDVPVVVSLLKKVWDYDDILDPRLEQAEVIFNDFADNEKLVPQSIATHSPHICYSLNWMAREDNARRVADMFLYSRVAQRIGEANPLSVDVAQDIGKAFDDGCGPSRVKEIVMALPLFRLKPKERCYKAMGLEAKVPTHHLHLVSLIKQAEPLERDYLRLRDGSWAKGAVAQLEAPKP